MPAASFQKFNSFTKAVNEKVHNLASDTLKVMLTNTAPVATNSVYADLIDLATGGGYTAGGTVSAQVSSTQTSGTYKLVISNVVFSATTGFGPFRYAVLYNDTATNKELIGFSDYGASISPGPSETFTVGFDQTNGVLTDA